MASPKSSSEKKPKLAKPQKALVAEMEEIEIKLGSAETELQQTQKNPKGISDESNQLKSEIEELKRRNQKTQDEIETLRKYVQAATENVAKEIEVPKKEQRQAEQQRLQFEAQIRDLGEKIATIMESRAEKPQPTVISSTPPIVKSDSSTDERRTVAQETSIQKISLAPKLQAGIQAEKIYKNVEAQISTMAFATPQGLALQSTFRLSGADALMLAYDGLPFQISWYAHKLAGEGSVLLMTSEKNLTENKLEYIIKTDAPPVTSGTYRLMTIAIFPTARNLMAHCQGPIIQAT